MNPFMRSQVKFNGILKNEVDSKETPEDGISDEPEWSHPGSDVCFQSHSDAIIFLEELQTNRTNPAKTEDV